MLKMKRIKLRNYFILIIRIATKNFVIMIIIFSSLIIFFYLNSDKLSIKEIRDINTKLLIETLEFQQLSIVIIKKTLQNQRLSQKIINI